jgi:hypothetical protein
LIVAKTKPELTERPLTHREDPLLSIKEAAAQLGVPYTTLHGWVTQIGRRRLKHVKYPSGIRKIRQSVVNQILAATGVNGDATEELGYET